MSKTNFENLRIYQLAESIADHVWEITVKWDPFARDTIGRQIVRSADSIGANIAEGVGRWGLQDQKRFIYIARGSVNETVQIGQLKPLLEKLPPKLNAYANSLKARRSEPPSTINDQPTVL